MLKERKTRHKCKRTSYLKCFKCGKKGHVAKSCDVVFNHIGVNKGQHLKGQQVDSKQVDSIQHDDSLIVVKSCVLTVSNSTCESAKLCQTDVIGSN